MSRQRELYFHIIKDVDKTKKKQELKTAHFDLLRDTKRNKKVVKPITALE